MTGVAEDEPAAPTGRLGPTESLTPVNAEVATWRDHGSST